jgi:hypothetical protein
MGMLFDDLSSEAVNAVDDLRTAGSALAGLAAGERPCNRV